MDRRDFFDDDGEAWDGSTWVDVGDDGHWHPSAAERTRAFVLLGVLIGVLLLVAAVSSFGGGDEPEVAAVTTTTSTTAPETTTTQALPSSLDGETAPEQCRSDDRDALPLREPSELSVLVLNGAGVGGLAGDTVAALQVLGYTAAPENAEATAETSIEYAPGFCAEALELADALQIDPEAVVEGTADGEAQFVVMLGSDDYAG